MRSCALLVVSVGALCGSDATVSGPISGYVLRHSEVRAIAGIPGASQFSDPIAAGFSTAAVSTAAATAIGCADGTLQRADLRTGETKALTQPCPLSLSMSPTGRYAALVYKDAVAVLEAGSNETAWSTDAGASSCSISDSGERVLCLLAEGLVAISRDGTRVRILAAPDALAAAFLPSSETAVIASTSGVYLLRNASELVPLSDFAGATTVGGDGEYALAAAGQRIAVIRLADGFTTQIDAPAEVMGFSPLNSRSWFLATGESGPGWMLIRDADAAKVVFIPSEAVSHE